MTHKKIPQTASAEPVIYVHAKGREQISNLSLQNLLELDLPLCSRLFYEGMTQTTHGYDQPHKLLTELAELFPDRPVIFMRDGLQISRQLIDQLDKLLPKSDRQMAITLLSNAESSLNPYSGLQTKLDISQYDFAGLVSLLSPGQIHDVNRWPDHFVYFPARLVAQLTEQRGTGNMMQKLRAAGASLNVPDHLFLADPATKPITALKLQAYETPCPPPFGELSARIQDWFNAGITKLPFIPNRETPVTLHVTHSWGGGVAQWMNSFIETDKHQHNYQLHSQDIQSGQGFGQKLSLYAGNELRCPVASWWLTPAIESIADSHEAYREIMAEICKRYGVGRVMISSLIGHSLDALRTGLPCLQILHDHFPVWPLLSIDPEPYLQEMAMPELERALLENSKKLEFRDKSAAEWIDVQNAYIHALDEYKVKIVAPSKSVLEWQTRLAPAFKSISTELIPHGFPAMSNLEPVRPRPREDDRLRMVILGRMQPGKGQELLINALPELAKFVQVYLVGTGKSGEAFFGMPGIDVIQQYERDELASILNTIGPHFAALLSIVPETFSFTLSELQHMQIPVLATRVGSFPSRIEQDETGWLIDANPDALIRQVTALCDAPEKIERVRSKLISIEESSLERMFNAYNKLCPVENVKHTWQPELASLNQHQHSAAEFQQLLSINQLQKAKNEQSELKQAVEQRTRWAQKFEKVAEQRTSWARELEIDLEQRTNWAQKLEKVAEQRTSWARELEKDVEQRTRWANELEKDVKKRTNWARKLEKDVKKRTDWARKLEKDVEQRTNWARELEKDLEQKTQWAQQTAKELKFEQERRERWVGELEMEIDNLQQTVTEKQADLEVMGRQFHLLENDHRQIESSLRKLETAHQELEIGHHHLQNEYHQTSENYQRELEFNALILGSTSWKITKPLRVARRMFSNFMLARAWNPLRWPLLLSQLVRSLSTSGLGGTLRRMQKGTVPTNQEAQPAVEIETNHIGDSSAPAAFPQIAQPKVSIVIPVYNQWNYTAACLTSLLETQGKYSFEVIVVDDQSSDETSEQLQKIAGLTFLRNEQNLGFVGSCNRGARHARGEYLVLLNNDTKVLKGWLDELVDTFDREPDAGLVGSRLVYADGSLQEAGGLIFNDGSGWNYGREQDAENPIYNFLRETDYCSGACIMLKTQYFQDIGAFDERYAPAYYEDTDLAFRVRESGLKVLVQPSSSIVHFEGVTSGTDTSSGTKMYQVVNREKFVDRWQTALQAQPAGIHDPNNTSEVLNASQHRNQGRVLVIDATTPEPDKDSGSVRLTNLMQCLRQLNYGVTFFADNRAYVGSYTQDLQKSGIEVQYSPWLDSIHEFFRNRGQEFDYVLISRHYIAINYLSLVRRYCPKAKFIFDTVDLHYLREQRLAKLENSISLKHTAKQTRRSELNVIKAADATLVVSSVEKEVLAEDAPGEQVHILSNIHQVPGRDKPFSDRKDIFFVGGYQHPPNIDAACWFVNDIWPLIHAQLPELRFHLIGSKAPEEIRALDGNGVVFHGFVESIDPFLSDCRLAVAPLRYGAGVKGKVNMSMAHGQPVVATPAAVEGMFTEHERELLVAEDAEAFAAEVIRLYQDEQLWNKLSDESVRNVEDHFSLATARDSILSLFDSFK